MADTTNIRIITPLGNLAYRNVSDLGIKFNRIVDDFTDISNRFQDFSYEFELPFIKENSLVFGAPEAKGSKNFFSINQSIDCQVYLNNDLLLDGLLNLESLPSGGYRCKFYSKFKELIDNLEAPNADGSNRTLRDLQFPIIQNWDYEASVVAHQQANYKNSDETFYQFPLMKYGTFYTEEGLYSGMTENLTRPPYSYPMIADQTYENFYLFINSNLGNGTSGITIGHKYYQRVYIHQVPPVVYVVSIIKQILNDAGWQLGGQFFNNKNLKRMVYTYAGDDDIFDQAISGLTTFSGSTPVNLQIAKFLPDNSQADFLKDIINMFNLYIKVDVENKICTLETYNTIFGDSYDPYDITQKLISKPEFTYNQHNNPTITFEKAQNQLIMGDNKVMTNSSNNAWTQQWVKTDNTNYNSLFNRKGTIDEIKIGFSEPNICRQFIFNDVSFSGPFTFAGWQAIYMPCLTKQTPTDNDNKKFNKATGDTYLQNNEGTIKFAGKGSIMYYYGRPLSEFENKAGMGALNDYMYYNMWTDTGLTLNKVYIPVLSPFQLMNYRTDVNAWLQGINASKVKDRRTTTATYLQALWQLMGRNGNVNSEVLTDYSLVFDDNEYFHDTLWTKFHKTKYDRYKYSEMLTANMRMSPVDWQEMQIERPILYNDEIYNIVSIEGYDPIRRTASIKLIKKL